jgi:hypothetical protein
MLSVGSGSILLVVPSFERCVYSGILDSMEAMASDALGAGQDEISIRSGLSSYDITNSC